MPTDKQETTLQEILRSPLDDMPQRSVPRWLPRVAGFAAAAVLVVVAIAWLGGDDDSTVSTAASSAATPQSGEAAATTAPEGTGGATTAPVEATTTTTPEADISGLWFDFETAVAGGRIAVIGGYAGRSTFSFRIPLEPMVVVAPADGAVSQAPGPGPRLGHDAVTVFDAGQIVVFGGGDTSQRRCQRIFGCPGQDTDDLFVYDPAASEWEQMQHEGGPEPRFGHTMVFHPPSGLVVLHGGAAFEDRSTGMVFGDTWVLDPATTTWEQRSDGPEARVYSSMAYDPASGNLLLFGGDGAGEDDTRLWSYDVAADEWTVLDDGSGPGARWEASLAIEPLGGGVFLSGGTGPVATAIEGGTATSIESLFDVWEWTGDSWAPHNPLPHEAESGSMVALPEAEALFVVTPGFGLFRYDAASDEWIPLP